MHLGQPEAPQRRLPVKCMSRVSALPPLQSALGLQSQPPPELQSFRVDSAARYGT